MTEVHTSSMQPDEPYEHGPVNGLPESLLKKEGATVAVIALMQRQGILNRDRRRDIQATAQLPDEVSSAIAKSLSKTDWNVLTHYLSAGHRWGNFWSVVRAEQRGRSVKGLKVYALAVDIQFLDAYMPGWGKLKLDEEALAASCPAWPQIKERLLGFWKEDKLPMPLGAFMLWPRLLSDLARWDELDNDLRIRVGYAVFALSSIGWTRWFIDEALSRCPHLKEELGLLGSRSGCVAANVSHTDINVGDEATGAVGSPPIRQLDVGQGSDIGQAVQALSEKLATLQGEWQMPPTRALLTRLISLGTEATEVLALMPEDKVPPRKIFEDRLAFLGDRLLEVARNGEMTWLSEDDVEGITARWWIALADVNSEEELVALADDAERALDRIDTAIKEMKGALAEVDKTRTAVTALDQDLSKPMSAVRRIDLANRLAEAKEDALAADRQQTNVMLFVLSSASPFGQAFDPAVDYVGQMSARTPGAASEKRVGDRPAETGSTQTVQEVRTPQPARGLDEAVAKVASDSEWAQSIAEQGSEVEPQDTEPRATLDAHATVSATGERPALESTSAVDHAKVEIGSASGPAIKSSPTEEAAALGEQARFSDSDGEQCRPVWALLRARKPALAYQFAHALQARYPSLLVPHPALLKAVALAPGLAASDGPLAMAVGEALLSIEAKWFEPGDTPSNWHSALNLLLIAATLRPMVLAPATGAASIARYRHLDGRHLALLELVRKVGEVSEPLTGFAIGPTALRSAADEASQKAQFAVLSKNAGDWLFERAPNKKFRYAPASQVWQQWLKPGGLVHRMISPAAQAEIGERAAVRSTAEDLSSYSIFLDRLRDTDRVQLQRRGQDIEAGALEHLWTATCEAVAIAKEWLGAASLLSESGGRLRALVARLQAAFAAHASAACDELSAQWEGDDWGQVAAASAVLRHEIEAIAQMFMESDAVPEAEPQPKELLARDLLLVPGTTLTEGWTVEQGGEPLIQALKAWCARPIGATEAFDARVLSGDLSGAELLLRQTSDAADNERRVQELDRSRELWIKDLQKQILQARRSTEVGLAYGYLSDSDRAGLESEISAVEVGLREMGRFDDAKRRIGSVVLNLDSQKARRVSAARSDFDRERASITEDVAKQLEAPLARSDIHTFNELLQRVRQGVEPWPEREHRRDAFRDFYTTLQADVLAQLSKLDPAEIDKSILGGGSIGPLSFELDGDQQVRQEAEQAYKAWATSYSRRTMSRDSLRRILEALGLAVRNLDQDKQGSGWALQTDPIDDREICPVPHFGSRAQGKYRVITLLERLTPEDLLQRVGESSQQTATIVLTLARSPARIWPDLARLSKERQRSFLILDESMLMFLLAQRGSRLATWFSIALPFTYSEPYDASAGFVPPEMFYGRSSELESVKAQGGCYFIYGGRQLGKTALLRRAEKTFHEPAADRYAVWIDLLAQGIGERRPSVDVWPSLLDKLRELRISGLDLPSVNPAKPASIDALLSAIKAFLLAKPGRRILLLLDEADHFFEQDGRQGSAYAETRRLKQLMDETERRFKVVFAGLHNVLRTASTSNQPLGHLNEAIRIGPLMNEREIRAAEQLITQPIEAAGYEFDDRSLVMRVLAQTNYYPSLIQLYCTQLLRHLRETKLRRREISGPRFKIDETDIESVFSGRPLRDAIRSKFRLTLQLDDRYEVIANAIGLEALEPGFDHARGIDWRTIRKDCTTAWWPEGFSTTSERDFLALLEEMVELGVLSQAKAPDRFSLRNPNVLLLLGSKQEISNTLQAEREPRIDFESTIFRPALGGRVDDPARNPLTYRQLDEVFQMRSSVSLVAASQASGSDNLLAGLRDHPGMNDSRLFVQLDRSADKRAFTQELDKEIKRRSSEGITVMYVPAAVPWDIEWVVAARAKLGALRSTTSFVSVVFFADPHRLWSLSAAVDEHRSWIEPWLSVLPWSRGFVRKWLEELQFPVEAADRLQTLTGYWGGLLEAIARVKGGALDFAHNLEHTQGHMDDSDWKDSCRRRLTGGIAEAEAGLAVLNSLGDGISDSDLVEFGGMSRGDADRFLRWAEPLGLVVRHAGSAWALDPFVKRILADRVS